MNEVKMKIVNILKDGGLYEGDPEAFTDKQFEEIFTDIDSLNLVNFIVEIENTFSIELPDEILLPESISSYENFVAIIEELLQSAV